MEEDFLVSVAEDLCATSGGRFGPELEGTDPTYTITVPVLQLQDPVCSNSRTWHSQINKINILKIV